MEGLDFIRMKPDNSVMKGGVSSETAVRALVEPGKAYAVYLRRVKRTGKSAKSSVPEEKKASRTTLRLEIPAGSYRAEWISPWTGELVKSEAFCSWRWNSALAFAGILRSYCVADQESER